MGSAVKIIKGLGSSGVLEFRAWAKGALGASKGVKRGVASGVKHELKHPSGKGIVVYTSKTENGKTVSAITEGMKSTEVTKPLGSRQGVGAHIDAAFESFRKSHLKEK